MLVLTRKLQEKITIAGNITVTVLRVKGQTVRIGIEAPREIRVVRGELPLEVAKEVPAEIMENLPALPAEDEESQDESAIATRQPAKSCNASRLPQRRKFDRYAQAPLKGAVMSAGVLAK
jgi:carbon storage regulator CsrA